MAKITEEQKEAVLELLREYERQEDHIVRDDIENDCPTKEYTPGDPKGQCDGDGHYLCNNCTYYNTENELKVFDRYFDEK